VNDKLKIRIKDYFKDLRIQKLDEKIGDLELIFLIQIFLQIKLEEIK